MWSEEKGQTKTEVEGGGGEGREKWGCRDRMLGIEESGEGKRHAADLTRRWN